MFKLKFIPTLDKRKTSIDLCILSNSKYKIYCFTKIRFEIKICLNEYSGKLKFTQH